MIIKPLIGITMNLEEQSSRDLNILDLDYGKAVLQAGGIPAPILGIETSIPDIIRLFDAFVFTCGDDIHPPRPPRSRSEKRFLRGGIKAQKPILAVCHGTQLVNVALGGSMYQDIPLQVPRSIKHGPAAKGERVFHHVEILEGTTLSRIMDSSRVRVRSSHHQALKNPGKGLRLSAVAQDGVIEAVESRGQNFLVAVQWHPEKTPRDRYTKKLFKALVDASKK